jgi:hypothetical protein
VTDHTDDSPAAETVSPSSDLFPFETKQLTGSVLKGLESRGFQDADLYAFRKQSLPGTKNKGPNRSGKCKTYPEDAGWPEDHIWNLFDKVLGRALIKTVPEPAVCFQDPKWNVYDEAKCQNLTTNWGDSFAR